MPVLRGGDAHPISIHAPRMGSDPPMLDRRAAGPLDFNPRSPDGERRSTAWTCPPPVRFQSTLPGWGATDAADVADGGFQISIHAPRMGSDRPRLRMCCTFIDFNPRSPDGERQPQHERAPPFLEISIHAPRMGSDTEGKASETDGKVFQSTLPGWGATCPSIGRCPTCSISIHAPRMGSDHPRPVHVEAQTQISIHAPRMGSDAHALLVEFEHAISIHAPRMGSDRRPRQAHHRKLISIHAPRMGSDLL